ncbi:MAG: response regulator, partial [Microcoleaceae cyanobacterium]
KPCNLDELSARIRALLRRGLDSLSPLIEWGDLSLNPSTCEVLYGGEVLNLTAKEYGLLKLFLYNNQRVFSCRAILDKLWAYDDAPTEDTVRAHIKGLRHKLKMAKAPRNFVETVYGLGYRLNLKYAEKAIPANNISEQANIDTASLEHQEKLHQAIAQVWEKFQSTMQERVQVIEMALVASRDNNLTAELRENAHRESHKLAGVLGMFGLNEGSTIAKQIERLLEPEQPLDDYIVTLLIELTEKLREQVDNNQSKRENPQKVATVSPTQTTFIESLKVPWQQAFILLITTDPIFADTLITEAEKYGMKTPVYWKPEQVLKNLETWDFLPTSSRPNVVIFDLDNFPNSLELLENITQQMTPLRGAVLSHHDDLLTRMKVTKLGSYIYVQKPLSSIQIMRAIADLFTPVTADTTVMIVDDDQDILLNLEEQLTAIGMKVVTLNQPSLFWQTLTKACPDVLILDIEMPDFNGIELCHVVRHDYHWRHLPILFITSHTNPNIKQQVFVAGADDYIQKSAISQELITRITNRLKLSRNWLTWAKNLMQFREE